MAESEYVELIDKYLVTRDESGTPSYSWTDNTGEIVRCKDCINWDTTWTNNFSPDYHYCPIVDGVRKGRFFCADAERRTGERSD